MGDAADDLESREITESLRQENAALHGFLGERDEERRFRCDTMRNVEGLRFYGLGPSPEEAMAECKQALLDADLPWNASRHGYVIRDLFTNQITRRYE